MKDNLHIIKYIKLKWPVLLAIVISIFVVIFFSIHIYSAQKAQYEDTVREAMTSANYQETVIRLTSVFKGGSLSSAGMQVNGLPKMSSSNGSGGPMIYMYKRVITDENGKDVQNEGSDDFQKVFDKETSSKEDITSTVTAGLNSALQGQMSVDFDVFDSLLVHTLKSKGEYAPYMLELVYTDSTALNRCVKSDNFRNHVLYRFTNDLALESSSKVYYRITTTPFMHIIDKLSGVIALSLIALLLIIACIIYLSRLLAAMKETEEMRDEFTHLVTHNMNNPIAIALASAEALKSIDGKDDDVQKRGQYTEIILRQLRKLSEQVRSILRTCKAKGMDDSFNPTDFNLYKSISSIVNQMNLAHPEASFVLEIDPEVSIKADTSLFEEMLENILQNAIKYSERKPEIQITYKDGKLAINDNGIGMPADALESIFGRYYKVEKMSSTPGYGLGLHFVKQVIDKHGWDIHVDSTVGEGSTFTITTS